MRIGFGGRAAFEGLALAALAFCFAGCARIVVETDPPGARIQCSDDGAPPWRPWRPEHHKDVSPSKTWVWWGTLRFFRAEKDGYYPSPPKLVDAFMFNYDKVTIALDPLPQLVAEQMKAKGLVYWPPTGTWVNPAEKGLVQYKDEWMTPEEKNIREQKEAGLVEFQGRWVKPEERDRLFAESQAGAGNVLYKGKWMNASDRDKQEAIDRKVADALTSGTMALPPIGTMPRPMANKTEIKVSNGTRSPIRVYFSGPTSFELPIDAFDLESREVAPGLYRIAIAPQTAEFPTQAGEVTFEDVAKTKRGVVYSLDYQGDPGSLLRKIQSEKRVEIKTPKIEVPEIQVPKDQPEEAASQPTEAEQAAAREIMARVRAGDLTMEEAQKQLPESVQKQFAQRQGGRRPGGEGEAGAQGEPGPGAGAERGKAGAGGKARGPEAGGPGGPGGPSGQAGEQGKRRPAAGEGAGAGAASRPVQREQSAPTTRPAIPTTQPAQPAPPPPIPTTQPAQP